MRTRILWEVTVALHCPLHSFSTFVEVPVQLVGDAGLVRSVFCTLYLPLFIKYLAIRLFPLPWGILQ